MQGPAEKKWLKIQFVLCNGLKKLFVATVEVRLEIERATRDDGTIENSQLLKNRLQEELKNSLLNSLITFNQMNEQGDRHVASQTLTSNIQAIESIVEIAKLVGVKCGSIILLLAFQSLEKLDLFWNQLTTREMERKLKHDLITEDILLKFKCRNIDISLHVDENQYQKAREYLGKFS